MAGKASNHYDVIVVGGGTAGWIAALSAARSGSKVLVVERRGFLGGVLCTGLPFLGFHDVNQVQVVKGFAHEFVKRLEAKGECLGYHLTDLWFGAIACANPGVVKPLIIEMLMDEDVDLLLFSQVVGVNTAAGRITEITVQHKLRQETYSANIFIDTSGDAVLVYHAGGEMQVSDTVQPPTLPFRLQGVDLSRLRDHLKRTQGAFVDWRMRPGTKVTDEFLDRTQMFFIHPELIDKVDTRGDYSPLINRFMFTVTPDGSGVAVNMLRARHTDGTDSASLSRATNVLYGNLLPLVEGFRSMIPGFENCYLVGTEDEIQLRETMRITGLYTLTKDDVMTTRSFDDNIALGGYFIDVHSSNDSAGTWRMLDGHYGIPYRTLIPKDVDGVIAAGRVISGDKEAAGSYRVMATSMAMGQAAGTAAALCASQGISPRDVDIAELQSVLRKNDALIDVRNETKTAEPQQTSMG